jgi:isopenicillin-N N-acyltransferase like protein
MQPPDFQEFLDRLEPAFKTDFTMRRKILLSQVVIFLLVSVLPLPAAEADRPFREGRFETAELRYINDTPVLICSGSAEEMGRQKAALTAGALEKMIVYPRQMMEKLRPQAEAQKKFLETARALVANIPADHRAEMRAFSEQANLREQWDMGLLGNVIVDIWRGSFGCSSLIVEAPHSKTGGPLFGRNLDFFTQGILDNLTLVTIQRPQGKHAFASVGFPGLFGCLSGINDAGLALAVHEVFLSKDRAPLFNPQGVPYTFCFRRILEECTTVEEAEKLLRDTPRTTLLNLAVCDRRRAAVFEITPKTVAVRPAEDGVCLCTNHFRTPELAARLPLMPRCWRYPILAQCRDELPLSVEDIHKKLHEVKQNKLTVQTMVFETEPLVLHLAVGSCPSSALPLKKIDLAPLFKPQGEAEK